MKALARLAPIVCTAMRSLQGHLLVASPHLENPAFSKSVVLVIAHHKGGALGVVLNCRMAQTIETLWHQISSRPCLRTEPVRRGGPESGPLLALHATRGVGEHESPQGVFLASHRDQLEQLVSQRGGILRLFVGHVRWQKDQLERELEQGEWHVLPATAKHVFGDDDLLWANSLREIGRTVLLDSLSLTHLPEDPQLN